MCNLSLDALRLVPEVECTEDDASCGLIMILPRRMHALTTLRLNGKMYEVWRLGRKWLPASSACNLRTLDTSCSNLRGPLPEGMDALESIDISSCHNVASHWLPESSAAHVHTLIASHSNLSCVPPGMTSPQELNMGSCKLAEGHLWLPASSAACVSQLLMQSSTMQRVPPELTALKAVFIDGCRHLDPDDWLPLSSRIGVRELQVTLVNITS